MFVPSKGGAAFDDGAFVVNNGGRAESYGPARQIMEWDAGYRRPFICPRTGKPKVVVNSGRWTIEKGERVPLKEARLVRDVINEDGIFSDVLMAANATALTPFQWRQLDTKIQTAARQPLQFWADLLAANPVGGFDAWSKMTYEYAAMNDPGEAIVDMDGLTDSGRNAKTLLAHDGVPLALTHSDFSLGSRELAGSKAAGMPFDTTLGETAGRRIAEMTEDTSIGLTAGSSLEYGTRTTGIGSHRGLIKLYGATTFPNRLTKTNFTAPTAGGWVPDTTYNEVLAAIKQLTDQRFYGPWNLYYSTDYDQYMNRVYSLSGGNTPGETLISMLKKNTNISAVKPLWRLTSTFTLLFVQMTSNVCRAINGQGITTVQWEVKGGMQLNYKTYVIWVPNFLSDFDARTGLLHGTTA